MNFFYKSKIKLNNIITLETDKKISDIRKRASAVAKQALWKHFIQYYYEAYDIALRHAIKRQLTTN